MEEIDYLRMNIADLIKECDDLDLLYLIYGLLTKTVSE